MDKIKNQIGVGTANISNRAKEYVNDVLNSGRLSYGKYLKKFEEEFAREHEKKYAVMMNSGTSALRLALACLKEKYNWGPETEIILPAVTFIADFNGCPSIHLSTFATSSLYFPTSRSYRCQEKKSSRSLFCRI